MSKPTRPKSDHEIDAMREGGRMLAHVLQFLKTKAVPGITTGELSTMAGEELKRLGGQPAFLGYHGFPAPVCISVNDEIVHGIPKNDMVVEAGDLLSMDFGVKHKGLITDSAITIIVGRPKSDRETNLVEATRLSLEAGLQVIKAGCRVGDIGSAVAAVLQENKLGIVRDLVGHGVGDDLHEDPNIPNFGRAGSGVTLSSGMTIAVEPMATLGDYRVFVDNDGWTVKTRDGSRSAHFEHTVLVTDNGVEILTA